MLNHISTTNNEDTQSYFLPAKPNKQSLPKRHLPYALGTQGSVRKVLRQEHKFLLTDLQYRQYKASISKIIHEDKNNGAEGYMVRTLYFDTLDDNDYNTKVDGLESRRKIRLRIYNTDSDYALLEIKQKQSIYLMKRSIKITRDDAVQLSKGIYTPLLYYDDPLALECYSLMTARGYRPKAIIQYQRIAFVGEGNEIRITFDSNLVATESCFDLFSGKLSLYPVFNSFNAVLEVKYNGFLFGYIKDFLQRLDKSAVATSKYCMSRAATLGTDY